MLEQSIPYEQFGRAFLERAVTPTRVSSTIEAVAGREISVGPLAAGPAGAAEAHATGRILPVEVDDVEGGERLRFVATIPVELDLDVVVAGVHHRLDATARVPLHLEVHAVEPLGLRIDVAKVQRADVDVEVRAHGLRAKVLQRIGNVDQELRRHVAAVVNERLGGDEALRARTIDLLPLIDRAWEDPSEK